MSDDKEDFNNKLLIAELLIRITALETILISSGVVKQDELELKIGEFTEKITQSIVSKINKPNIGN